MTFGCGTLLTSFKIVSSDIRSETADSQEHSKNNKFYDGLNHVWL